MTDRPVVFGEFGLAQALDRRRLHAQESQLARVPHTRPRIKRIIRRVERDRVLLERTGVHFGKLED